MKPFIFFVILFGISSFGFGQLTISQEIGQQNIAIGKTARQSSTPFSIGLPGNAVDGNTNGQWAPFANSITHTRKQAFPWWELDLGDVYDISEIRVWSRTDGGCRDCYTEFFLIVTEESILTNGETENQYPSGPHYFVNSGKGMLSIQQAERGRYVRIYVDAEARLQLAEVEVFGERVENEVIAASATRG